MWLRFGLGVFTASMLLSNISFAADVIEQSELLGGGFYGSIYVGADIGIDRDNGKTITTPGILFGGKLANDNADTPWGWQLDSESKYSDISWARPRPVDLDGYVFGNGATAHLTYRPDLNSKLGIYAGYGATHFGIESTNGTFLAGPITEVTSLDVLAAIGLEGFTQLGEATWIQGRVGIIDPLYSAASAGDGTTTVDVSDTDILGKNVGGMVAVSLSHDFSDAIAVHGDASLAALHLFGGDVSSTLILVAGADYKFDAAPVKLGIADGYVYNATGGDGNGFFNVSTRLTYSFGAPSASSTGRLFGGSAFSLGL